MTRTDDDRWDLASSVGVTATMVAAARALATAEPDPLINDPFAAGLVRAIGIGSKSVEALAAAVRTGLCDLIMVAGRLTLLDDSGAELIPLCQRYGVGIVNVGVFNSGALAAPTPSPELHFEYGRIGRERLAELKRIHEACAGFGVSVLDAALQYSWRLPAVVNVTVGASTRQQLTRSMMGMSAAIDPAVWPALTAARQGR